MKLGKRILRIVLISLAMPPVFVLATAFNEDLQRSGFAFTLKCGSYSCGFYQIQLEVTHTENAWDIK